MTRTSLADVLRVRMVRGRQAGRLVGAAVSIASNIAECCGRRSNRELLSFLRVSAGSASELACQLRIATKVGLGEPAVAERLSSEVQRVARMLNRLIVFHRSQTARGRDEGRP